MTACKRDFFRKEFLFFFFLSDDFGDLLYHLLPCREEIHAKNYSIRMVFHWSIISMDYFCFFRSQFTCLGIIRFILTLILLILLTIDAFQTTAVGIALGVLLIVIIIIEGILFVSIQWRYNRVADGKNIFHWFRFCSSSSQFDWWGYLMDKNYLKIFYLFIWKKSDELKDAERNNILSLTILNPKKNLLNNVDMIERKLHIVPCEIIEEERHFIPWETIT